MPGRRGWVLGLVLAWGRVLQAFGAAPDPAVERGSRAMTATGYLKPGWGDDAYRRVGQFWGEPAPDPATAPEAYSAAFIRRYGLNPAPYPNDGLPMGLRRGVNPDGTRTGIQVDCLACHGGSIGGMSHVGLGNSTLDMKSLFDDLDRAQGKRPPASPFVLNSTRGTVNAGMLSAVLLSVRNADLSMRRFPLPLGANLPELDVPAWWLLGKKSTMYYDGRTDARSVRANMQFLLGEKSLQELKDLEPTFRDIQAWLKSLKPPRYPFPRDAARADRGKVVFEKACAKCHGTYGPDGTYPNAIVELKVIGTDPARALGLSDRLVAHYNETWFGEEYAVDEQMIGYQAPPLDGVWATAPYLHNGSVPTLAALLKSSDRPARFKRPPSTDFAYYDQVNVGWKYEVVTEPPSPGLPPFEARFIYDTARFGLGNGGHTFGDKLSNDERLDLIEYLKTL
ncbi:MAG: c-type cytochrome [Planctomycetaceae bacterium]|nr:c-type cytochrome [Planctomycetaceae bacterium]